MVGAAGAGKSTTLAAMINHRNETSSDHILTIEDPIEFLHSNKHVFGLYPRLVSAAAQTWFRVDGADKLTKEKEILRSFRKGRSLPGLIGDAFKLARSWR